MSAVILVELLIDDRLVVTRRCDNPDEAWRWVSSVAARLTPWSSESIRFRINVSARDALRVASTSAGALSTPVTWGQTSEA